MWSSRLTAEGAKRTQHNSGGRPRTSVGEVDIHVDAGGDDVELGVEDVDALDDAVEAWHREVRVGLVLAHCGSDGRQNSSGQLEMGRMAMLSG